jgi:hypothetical protein
MSEKLPKNRKFPSLPLARLSLSSFPLNNTTHHGRTQTHTGRDERADARGGKVRPLLPSLPHRCFPASLTLANSLLSTHRPFETVERTIKGRRVRTYKNLPSSVRDLWAASAVRPSFLTFQTPADPLHPHRPSLASSSWFTSLNAFPTATLMLECRNLLRSFTLEE